MISETNPIFGIELYNLLKMVFKENEKNHLSIISHYKSSDGNLNFDEILYEFSFEHKLYYCSKDYKEDSKIEWRIEKIKARDRIKGVVYTPKWIINLILDSVLDSVKKLSSKIQVDIYNLLDFSMKEKNNNKINRILKIADIACGTGRFLHVFYNWFINLNSLIFSSRFNNSNLFIELYGYDLDKMALTLAKKYSDNIMHNKYINQETKKIKFNRTLSFNSNQLNSTQLNSTQLNSTQLNSSKKRIKWFWMNQNSLLSRITEAPFDLIIGNPPYVESRSIPDAEWEKLRNKYKLTHKRFDLSIVFLERIFELLGNYSIAGLITNNKWLISDYGKKIREFLLKNSLILRIINLSTLKVFKDVSTYPIIIIFMKIPLNHDLHYPEYQISNHYIEFLGIIQDKKSKDVYKLINKQLVKQELFLELPDKIITVNLDQTGLGLLIKMRSNVPKNGYYLGDKKRKLCPVVLKKGVHTGNVKNKLINNPFPFLLQSSLQLQNDKFSSVCIEFRTREPLTRGSLTREPGNEEDSQNQFKIQNMKFEYFNKGPWVPLLTSKEKLSRYSTEWKGLWICYNKNLISKKDGDYGSLREPWIFFNKAKILIKLFGKVLQCSLDTHGYCVNNSVILIVFKHYRSSNLHKKKGQFKLKINASIFGHSSFEKDNHLSEIDYLYYLLALLNSPLISVYYSLLFHSSHVRGEYMQFYIKDLSEIPIIAPRKSNIKIVKKIINKTKELEKLIKESKKVAALTNHNQLIIKQEQFISNLIFKLYDLNYKEIEFVEKKYQILLKI